MRCLDSITDAMDMNLSELWATTRAGAVPASSTRSATARTWNKRYFVTNLNAESPARLPGIFGGIQQKNAKSATF